MPSDTSKNQDKIYISLADASKSCSYSQDYLSLRARQGKLKAIKDGRNWVTSKAWLEEYINKYKYSDNNQNNQENLFSYWPKLALILVLALALIRFSPNFIAKISDFLIDLGEKTEHISQELAPASILDNFKAVIKKNEELKLDVKNAGKQGLGFILETFGQSFKTIGQAGKSSSNSLKGLDQNLNAGILSVWKNFEQGIKTAEKDVFKKVSGIFKSDIIVRQETVVQPEIIKEKNIIQEKIVEQKIVSTEIIPEGKLEELDQKILEIRGLAQNTNKNQIITEHRIIETIGTSAIGVSRDLSVGGSAFFGSSTSSLDQFKVYAAANFYEDISAGGALTVSGTSTFNNTVAVNATTTFAGNLLPGSDDSYDLGYSGAEWKDLYLDGIAYIDSLTLGNSTSTVVSILDEDNLASDSASALATQQSIKAYVDTQLSGGVSGAAGYISKFTGTNIVGNSVIYELAGNVGIGTTNPSAAKLQVAGTGQIEGALTITTGGLAVTGDSNITGALGSLTGLTSSGTITFSGLTADRLVTTTTGGVLTNTITSANLALSVSDETGTGTLVLANTPTLVTPVLGVATYTTLSGGDITDSSLTAGRVTFAGTGGLLSDDADLTFSTDTLSATKLAARPSVSTPSLISTGALGITPAAGSNFNIALSTTGDFAVNTDDLYVDTSAGRVGIWTPGPGA